MKTQLLCLLAAASPLLSIETLDIDMTPHEKKKTGVYKLTDKEKATLQQWIDTHYEKRSEPLPQPEVSEQRALLQENLQNGQYIRLANGTAWNIHPDDTNISQGWITPVDIIVTQSGDSEYPYQLTNTVTGSSLRAKKIDKIPFSRRPNILQHHQNK